MVHRSRLLISSLLGMTLVSFEASANPTVQMSPNPPTCYMVTASGKFHNLKSVCQMGSDLDNSPLKFSEVGLQVTIVDAKPQLAMSGVLTNISNQRVPISTVTCRLMVDNQVISTHNIAIVTGKRGMQPKESRTFHQPVNIPSLDGIPLSKLRVQVVGFRR